MLSATRGKGGARGMTNTEPQWLRAGVDSQADDAEGQMNQLSRASLGARITLATARGEGWYSYTVTTYEPLPFANVALSS